jgi:hypothetical protein
MGRINLFEVMFTIYKRQIKSRRWYLYIFYHSLSMVTANAWLLYRREAFPKEQQATADEVVPNPGCYLPHVPRKGASWSTIPEDSTTSQEALCPTWSSA